MKDIFEPDYIVIQCGVDGLAGDPCAIFNLSLGAADGSLGWCIGRVINEWSGKKLLLGGGKTNISFYYLSPIKFSGGYNSPNAARAWTYLTSIAVRTNSSSSIRLLNTIMYSWGGPSHLIRKYLTTPPSLSTGPLLRSTSRLATCRIRTLMITYKG